MDSLQSTVAKLHRARLILLTVADEIAASRQEWEASIALKFITKQAAQEAIDRLETEAKSIRIEMFDGETKTPLYGIGIRDRAELLYTEEDALQWAIDHELALKLDKPAFEKIAKVSPPEFVTINTVRTATIARDLSDWADENIEELPF